MTVRRFSISFDEDLADAVSTSAENANQALSSWLAEAARRRVKQEALMHAVEDYEQEFGLISEADLAAAMKQLDAKTHPKPAAKTAPKRARAKRRAA